jgi:hypothetical protein
VIISSLTASPLSAAPFPRLRSCNLTQKTAAFAAALGGEMMMADDATPEELWRRHTEESPHTSDARRQADSFKWLVGKYAPRTYGEPLRPTDMSA